MFPCIPPPSTATRFFLFLFTKNNILASIYYAPFGKGRSPSKHGNFATNRMENAKWSPFGRRGCTIRIFHTSCELWRYILRAVPKVHTHRKKKKIWIAWNRSWILLSLQQSLRVLNNWSIIYNRISLCFSRGLLLLFVPLYSVVCVFRATIFYADKIKIKIADLFAIMAYYACLGAQTRGER